MTNSKNYTSLSTAAYLYQIFIILTNFTVLNLFYNRVTIINNLEADTERQFQTGNDSYKGFQDSNSTNLETFGIHYSNIPTYTLRNTNSELGLDDIQLDNTVCGPGQTLIFYGIVSEDHAPGLHWYHSNVLGSSALQVMGGLFGAIVIDSESIDSSATKSALQFLSVLQSMSSYLMVFSHVMLETVNIDLAERSWGDLVYGRDSFSTAWSLSRLSAACGSTLPIDPIYFPLSTTTNSITNNTANSTSDNNSNNTSLLVKDAWFTNGQYQPTLTLETDKWVVMDFLAASGDRILELEIKASHSDDKNLFQNIVDVSTCNMQLLALDGVYLTHSRELKHHPLIQGSRASVAVQCSISGTYYLMSVSTTDEKHPYYPIGSLESKTVQVLVILEVEGQDATPAEGFFDLSGIARPSYLQPFIDLTSTDNGVGYSASYSGYNSSNNTNSNSNSSGANNASSNVPEHWSISTAQAGCCGNNKINKKNDETLFWLGVGEDCNLPCLSETTCKLLYGEDYSVNNLPSVLAGTCSYTTNTTSRVNIGTYSDP
jgi:FtsP/CotA-like multicopper oxidase with cupredoxin domain